MEYYLEDADDIERLIRLLAETPGEELLFMNSAEFERFAEATREQNVYIAEAYVKAFICFLKIMRLVMIRKIELYPRELVERRVVEYRDEYLTEYIELYKEQIGRAEKLLLAWVQASTADDAHYAAQFIRELIASSTADEMMRYVQHIGPAESYQEANDHLSTGEEVENSIKSFIRDKLQDKPRLSGKLIERCFQALNEVISIVFRAGS